MYSSSGSALDNRASGEQSERNKTSSFGHLNRSSGLGKHMSMQETRLPQSRFLNLPDKSQQSIDNFDVAEGDQNNQTDRMRGDSFGRRKRVST
jgi:hypothetical protein